MIQETPALSVEEIDGKPVTAERHRSGPIIMSSVRPATPEEIAEATRHFEKNGKCEIHLVYDEDCWPYYIRRCGICNSYVGLI